MGLGTEYRVQGTGCSVTALVYRFAISIVICKLYTVLVLDHRRLTNGTSEDIILCQ